MQPINALDDVRRLIADENKCELYKPVLDELRKYGLDSDDLREIIQYELGEIHCYKSLPTLKHYQGTTSDYYSIWVDSCNNKMFLKLLIVSTSDGRRLVVTSFKKDNYNAV